MHHKLWSRSRRYGYVVLVGVAFLSGCSAGGAGSDPAGPFQHGEGVPAASTAVVRWAQALGPGGYAPGAEATSFNDPSEAFGPASGVATDVVSLGRGGEITLDLVNPITDGTGADFAVFENGFTGNGTLFAELAFVSVSSDGLIWTRFRTATLSTSPVTAFGQIDPTQYSGFAGLHAAGVGTAFDLAELSETAEVTSGDVDLSSVRYVRISDIVGDGTTLADDGNPIYDPYPTEGSAGFDLDGLAVLQ